MTVDCLGRTKEKGGRERRMEGETIGIIGEKIEALRDTEMRGMSRPEGLRSIGGREGKGREREVGVRTEEVRLGEG